ncbi:MAG: FAD-dependent oxidoreductase [Burkholderiales bacterium]|nr:FAD-dependent oxidoreductase [Burkholderiales bacterium]
MLPGLPSAWAGRLAWTVLDADFGDGDRFLSIWRAWQLDAQRPRMLHYVGVTADATRLSTHAALADVCADLGPGFHRILLDNGQVSLTLCLGETQAMLGEQVFQADTLFANAPADKWAAQLLARRCKRETRFCVALPAHASTATSIANTTALLHAAGFVLDGPTTDPATLTGSFNPRWELSHTRTPSAHVVSAPARCAVIGAGLAGASVAQALAARGWQVSVLDQEMKPAAGASGLPVGLAVPHVSADDNPRSRLTRGGTRLLAQHAQRLLARGEDWDASGVRELHGDGDSLWHPQALWIKPATLVHAWLVQPGIRFVPHAKVTKLMRVDGVWQLLGAQGEELGCFEVVVLANAMGCVPLLRTGLGTDAQLQPELQDKLAALHAVHGTMSYGTYAEVLPGLPATPVNGNGCFIPHVPGPDGEQWCAGATFEPDALAAADTQAQHALNMQRLRQLLPMAEYDLPDTLDRGPVTQWTSTRCVTHDRLPLVGPVETAAGPGLWLCVGMGARGLSLSALCAELLAARLGAEPLPVEFSLSRSLDVNRVRRKPVLQAGA